MQLTLMLNNLRMRLAKNIDFVEKRKVPQEERKGLSKSNI